MVAFPCCRRISNSVIVRIPGHDELCAEFDSAGKIEIIRRFGRCCTPEDSGRGTSSLYGAQETRHYQRRATRPSFPPEIGTSRVLQPDEVWFGSPPIVAGSRRRRRPGIVAGKS